MQMDKTGIMVQTQLKTKPRRILLKLNSKEVNPWPYLSSIMQCTLCLPRETKLAACKISTSNVRKHVKVR